MKQVLGCAAGAVALTLALAAPAAGQTVTLRVDDDRAQCPNAEFTEIQEAVQAAPPGAQIFVCEGVYEGNVIVDKALTLRGAKRGNAARPRSEDTDTDGEAVVVNAGLGGFDVVASGVVIEGFTILGQPGATTYPNAGIYTRTGSARTFIDNVIRDNRLGIYLEGPQSGVEIERNAIVSNTGTNIAAPAPNPPNGGIFAAPGPVTASDIEHNWFAHNGQFSMNLNLTNDVDIAHNDSFDEGTFAVLFNEVTDTRVVHNKAENLRASGVFLGGTGANGVEIAYNDFSGGAVNTNGSGVRATAAGPGTLPNVFRNLLIEHNRFELFRFDGVSLNRTENARVQFNKLERNTQSGVRFQNADASVVRDNHAFDNGKDGVNIEAQSSGNTIEGNDLRDNVEHDCHDDTAGPGSGGTANVWLRNRGLTQNRPGLCPGAVVVP